MEPVRRLPDRRLGGVEGQGIFRFRITESAFLIEKFPVVASPQNFSLRWMTFRIRKFSS